MPQNSGHTDGSSSIPWSFASARRVTHPSSLTRTAQPEFLSCGAGWDVAGAGCIVFVLRASRRKTTTRLRLCWDWPQWPAYGSRVGPTQTRVKCRGADAQVGGRGEGPALRQLLAVLYSPCPTNTIFF